jgi:type IV pilus assembly protein PilQ
MVRRLGVVPLVVASAMIGGTIFSDEIISPSNKYDLSSVPPFVENLSKKDRTEREDVQQKEFEDILKKVITGDKKTLETESDALVNNPQKLNNFISRLPDAPDAKVSSEFLEFLEEQYDDPFLQNKKITLSLKQTDIRDVIELLGKSGGLNFIVDDDVSGTVQSFHVKDVPLSVVLQMLLTNNRPRLVLIKDCDVFRVASLSSVEDALTVKMEKNFVHEVVTLNHLHWTETLKMNLERMWFAILGSVSGKSGFYFSCDEHSKKVFFCGRKKHTEAFRNFLKEIDIRIPQIKIEARFVCADKSFEESLGFQFSGIYNRRASIGSGFGFIGGGPLDDVKNVPAAQSSASLVDWALNMLPSPTEIATNLKIPFIFGGSDLNTKRLNIVLNAAENKSEIKTLLKPTVLTNNKEMSEILVGESIPIETVVEESVEGRLRNVQTANYKDVGIQLKVRPTLSADLENVFLDIFIENSQEGTKISSGDKYIPITTTRSRSRVLLKNGQTTLISGLIKNIQRDEKTNTPLLSEIPVLGWLFKGKRKKEEDKQLMIFITPTII